MDTKFLEDTGFVGDKDSKHWGMITFLKQETSCKTNNGMYPIQYKTQSFVCALLFPQSTETKWLPLSSLSAICSH